MNRPTNSRSLSAHNVLLAPLLSLVLLTGMFGLAGCQKSDAQAEASASEKAIPVRVVTIGDGPSAPPLRSHGITLPKEGARLSFKVGGVVSTIAVKQGDVVKKGDLLARIEQTEIASQVERAAQAAAKARRDRERGESLYRDQVITLEQVQDLRTAAAVANAELKSARFNQGYALIEAPFDGVVIRRLAEERELVQSGQPILVLTEQAEGFVIRSALSDRDIVQVRLDDRATIHFDAHPNLEFTGSVSEIASAANEQTGMFDVELTLDPTQATLKSGLVASFELASSAAAEHRLAYVPFSALVSGHERKASIYVLEQGRAVKREVTIAFIDREQVAVQSGVSAGETVIAEGAMFVRDGSLVRVVQDDASVERVADLGEVEPG